jgi:hypothetical protein
MPAVPALDLNVITSTGHYLLILATAAALGAALGLIRPVRRTLVPRSAHVVQTQILLAIVGALIIIVVGENLARAFAIVGAAGLIRYRARIRDPKDAGVMERECTVSRSLRARSSSLCCGCSNRASRRSARASS